MFLFLVAGLPAFGWLIGSWFFSGRLGSRDFLAPAGYGFAAAVPAAYLQGLIGNQGFSPLDPLEFLATTTLLEFLLPAALALVSLALVARLRGEALGYDFDARSFPFFIGFFTYQACSAWFFGGIEADGYHLLYLPFLWMLLVFVMAFQAASMFSGSKLGLLFAAARISVLCLAFGAAALLFRENFEIFAWVLAFALAGFFILGYRHGFPSVRDIIELLRI